MISAKKKKKDCCCLYRTAKGQTLEENEGEEHRWKKAIKAHIFP